MVELTYKPKSSIVSLETTDYVKVRLYDSLYILKEIQQIRNLLEEDSQTISLELDTFGATSVLYLPPGKYKIEVNNHFVIGSGIDDNNVRLITTMSM